MDEKTDLSSTSTEPTTEILEPAASPAEADADNEIDSEVSGTASAGIDDADQKTPEPEIENAEIQPEIGSNSDANALISELNDVSLSVANTDAADSFLEALTSQNPSDSTESIETPASQEQTTDTDITDTDVVESNDISMPTLALTLEEEPETVSLESNDKTVDNNEEKDPVCTLEEELKRMHEGDPEDMDVVQNKSQDMKLDNEETKQSIDESKDKIEAPIMKDSDLEEMLAADEVLQDPQTIKASQNDIKSNDILVCGKCYDVFTFIEEFKNHKLQKCTQKSIATMCEFESKPQVWGFILWKNKQFKTIKLDDTKNEWEIYQKWTGLAQIDKDAWISAGQTLQYYSKIGNAKLTEIKVQKAVKDDEKDPLALDGFADNKENSTFDTAKSPLLEVKRTVINKPKTVPTNQKVNDPNSNRAMRTVQTAQKSEYAVERIVAKRFNPKKKSWEYQIKWEHFPNEDNTWEPLSNLNHCRQMVDEFEEQLKKLKAEKAKQQAAIAAKSPPKIRPVLSSPGSSSSLGGKIITPIRPQRTSKQKAMDQVKAWCGNISDEEGPNTGIKRSRSPDSDESFEKRLKFDENSEDSEPDTKPKIQQYRKIAPKTPVTQSSTPIQIIKNGIGKNTPLPQNILIPDANGVVRINQKQLPSLSTGVYIMSKTAGIIKLDSNTSKVATSGGQTIVKVAPKIGQTQIKIMKKDGTSTQQIVQMSPKMQVTPRVMQKHITKAKKIVSDLKPSPIVKRVQEIVKKQPVILTPKEVEKKISVKKLIPELPKKPNLLIKTKENIQSTRTSRDTKDDESDDGLEELPFPEEIKVPEPEENDAEEFTLDPSTGKIAGVEYPDIPDPEPIEEPNKSDMSLDNIVKLAAADITEEDLKNEPQDLDIDMHDVREDEDDDDEEFQPKLKVVTKTEPRSLPEPQRRFVTASPMKQVVKMAVTSRKVSANPTSILNKALTTPQVVRRSVVGPGTPRVQQRVLNQTVARNSLSGPVVRQINTYVRTKPTPPKPRFNIAGDSRLIKSMHETSPKNVYTYARPVVQNSPAARKIGSTTIRSASIPIVNSPQQKPQTKLVRTSSGIVQRVVSSPVKREPMIVRAHPEKIERKVVQTKPKTVISMPSLMSDDELLLTSKATPQQKLKSPPAVVKQHLEESQEYNEEPTVLASEDPSGTNVKMSLQESEEVAAAGQEQSVASLTPDMSSFTLADNENPIFITGDDGTVYQVAGQNEQGQTILLTQGSDGQQQCLLVTNEVADAMETPAAEEPQPQEISMPDISTDVTEPLSVKTDQAESSDQVVAQVVRAEPPSPGGTHKVVVMLPDGNLMVTQVSPEEYASLELE